MRTQAEMRAGLEADVLSACRALLGSVLVRGERRARLVEVEAYRAADDPGSHAHRGMTPRNRPMFGPAGRAYVYFTYGSHWMLNVTALPEGQAAAMLVRAAEPLTGLEAMYQGRLKARRDEDLLSGPGKIASAFGITGADNGIDLLDPASELRLEPGQPASEVLVGTRIGLALGKGDLLPWRFIDASRLRWASKPWPPRA